ncbi:tRNA lysidine(34) synthetase TilS [Mycoplasma sp. NEAQ87857]|uniref:tRNA lysidine(34) synthetase TilS n=1 Tax=Mycoplasma sp. NEAQ87857 TaxID=2683967 RepID=UPI0013170A10|nr:tRNA lysidine(34) synthetase TilS [Mycoplasma sp. NEAQ87857]QGZ97998.1 tRNA lysidine(34) synthetase TilS [Mycoplasma sp. NEAQ87857]
MDKKYLLAISGGGDSMFLLNEYKNKNIIVAHVNYNQRKTSWYDQKLVENFCKKNNIKLYVLNLKKDEFKTGNFQEWAREKRYSFFKEIYLKEKCDYLFTAHQKDDFLETAIFQKINKRFTYYYGIKKHNCIDEMNVYRPLLFKYTKKQIEKICYKNKIDYALDYSNLLPKYSRNRIRIMLNNINIIKKNWWILKFRIKNLFLNSTYKSVLREYKLWKEVKFEQNVFQLLKYKSELIHMLIYKNFPKENINLSSKKVHSIEKFILSNRRTSKYKLKDDIYLEKEKGKIISNNI